MLKNVLTTTIKIYQYVISPWTRPACRYLPTCSAYAVEALTEHNTPKALLIIFWRILRCNPFNEGGFDPLIKELNIKTQQKIYKGVVG